MLSFDTCSYYGRYYTMKKHLYKERYLEKKMRDARIEEMYEPYGGEKEYIKNYWKNKLYLSENKIKDLKKN